MTPGQLVRRLFGPRLFSPMARAYRSFFVSLDTVAACLPELPAGTELLEVGGGDGAMMNAILTRFPAVRATLIDLAPAIGGLIEPAHVERIRLLPATSVRAYAAQMARPPDVVLVADVLHHIPPEQRAAFFADLRALVAGHPTTLLIKDIEPGHVVATLSFLADKYISGDRTVALIARAEARRLVEEAFGPVPVAESALLERNPPNYLLVASLPAQ